MSKLFFHVVKDVDNSINIYPNTDDPVGIDVSVLDNTIIGGIFGSLTPTFSAAATEELDRFMDYAFDTGSDNIPGSSQSLECSAETESETLYYGRFFYTGRDAINNDYQFRVESGVLNLDDTLDGKKLNDPLLWADADLVHNYTMDEWRRTNDIQENTFLDEDYFYPFMDLGHWNEGRIKIPDDQVIADAPGIERNSYQPDLPANSGYWPESESINRNAFGNLTAESASNSGTQANARFINPTFFFGEVATGPQQQGTITHPMTPLRIDQLFPSIRFARVMEKAFEQAGATLDAPHWRNQLMDLFWFHKPHKGLGLDITRTNQDDGFIARNQITGGDVFNLGDINDIGLARQNSAERIYYTFGSTGDVIEDNPSDELNAGVFRIPNHGTFGFRFEGEFAVTNSGQPDNFFNNAFIVMEVQLRKNGEPFANQKLQRINNGGVDADYDGSFVLEGSANFIEGDIITATLSNIQRRSADTVTGSMSNPIFSTTKVSLDYSGVQVNLGDTFGDIDTIDVIDAGRTQFNMVITADKNRPNHFIQRHFNDWILAGNRLDWNDRISNPQFTTLKSQQPRTLNFFGAEDTDRLNEIATDNLPDGRVYGGHVEKSVGDVSTGEETIGEFFAPIIVAKPLVTQDLAKGTTSDPQNGIPHFYKYDSSPPATAESIEIKPRLGFSKVVDLPGNSFFYAQADNSVVQFMGNVRTLSNTNMNERDDLNFSSTNDLDDFSLPTSNDLYNKYWKQRIDWLNDEKNEKLTVDVFMTPAYFQELEYNETIHYKGSDYLINRFTWPDQSQPGIAVVELITYQNNFTNVFEEPSIRFVEDNGDELTVIVGFNGIALDTDLVTRIPLGLQTNVVGFDGGYFTGLETTGETLTGTVQWVTTDDRELEPSNFALSSTSGNIAFTSPVVNGIYLESDFTVTLGTNHQFISVDITGEVPLRVEGSTDFVLTLTLEQALIDAGVTLDNLGDVRGSIGGVGIILAQINPPSGERLLATSFSNSALPSTILGSSYSQVGTSVLATYRVEFQSTNTNVPLTISGDIPTDLGDAQTSQVTLDFIEMSANVSTIQDLTFSGVVGTRSDLSIPLYAADGFMLPRGNVSASIEAGKNYVTMFNALQAGDDVLLPFAIVWPVSDDTVMITFNASVIVAGSDTVTTTVNFLPPSGSSFAALGISLTETTETFTGNADTSLKYTNDVIAAPDLNIASVTLTEDGDVGGATLTASGIGDRAQISGLVSFTASNQTVNITVNAVTTRENHSVRFVVSTQTLSFGGSTTLESLQGYDLGDGTYSFTIPVESLSTMMFTSSFLPSASIGGATDVNGNNVSPTGFTANAATATLSGVDANIVISGTFPTAEGIDLVVPITITGEAALPQASAGSSFGINRVEVPANTSRDFTISIDANGQFRAVSTGNLLSIGAEDAILASSTTSVTGLVTFTVPSTATALENVSIIRLESFDGTVALGSILLDVTLAATPEELGNIDREYELIAGSEETRFGVGSTTRNIPAGDSITVISSTFPEILTDPVPTGARVVAGGVVAATATDSETVDGVSIVIGPAANAPNTLYFTL